MTPNECASSAGARRLAAACSLGSSGANPWPRRGDRAGSAARSRRSAAGRTREKLDGEGGCLLVERRVDGREENGAPATAGRESTARSVGCACGVSMDYSGSGWSSQCGEGRGDPARLAAPKRQVEEKPRQPQRQEWRRSGPGSRKTISGTRIAASTAASANASRRARFILREQPLVFLRGNLVRVPARPHDSQRQASPYGTSRVSPQSQETVIGGLCICIRFYGDPRMAVQRPIPGHRGGLKASETGATFARAARTVGA